MHPPLAFVVNVGSCAWVWYLGYNLNTPFWVALVLMTTFCVMQVLVMKQVDSVPHHRFRVLCSGATLLIAAVLTAYVYA